MKKGEKNQFALLSLSSIRRKRNVFGTTTFAITHKRTRAAHASLRSSDTFASSNSVKIKQQQQQQQQKKHSKQQRTVGSVRALCF